VINQLIALQYYPRQVFINSLHPITKFLGLVVISFMLFFVSDLIIFHIAFFSMGIILLKTAGYSLFRIQGGRLVVMTALLIAFIQLVFIKDGEILFSTGPARFTDQGLLMAVTVSLRFLTIILFSYLFVLSTEPTDFVLALVHLGLPYRFGFSIITAIRMVPIVKSEFTRISYAQITRGVAYKFLPFRQFLKNIKQFLKVMIISMFKRVNSLVISMEGRSFGLYNTRTFINEISYSAVDKIIIACEIILIPIIIFWRLM
jgi:energy-coupling factor transport system permease protein